MTVTHSETTHSESGVLVSNDRESTVALALRQFGWRPVRRGLWQARTQHGRARLRLVAEGPLWAHFTLSASALPAVTASRHLYCNTQLAGPAKFVVSLNGSPACRCDVPATLRDVWGSTERADPLEEHAVYWARSITLLANGQTGDSDSCVDIERVGSRLQESGRVVSRAADRLLIHEVRRGAFGQIRFERDERRGWRLAADLLHLPGPRCRLCRAASRLAAEANRRLPGVRFALGSHDPITLRCEFCFGRASVPDAWLAAALAAVETALALTLRELQALTDPELAKLLTAVPTAHSPPGQKGVSHANFVDTTRP